jgi:signal transduction histidine kinase
MPKHRLLDRQLKKYLPEGMEQDEHLKRFIQAVNDSYLAFDKDKELSEHAFSISEKEYVEIQSKLRDEINVRMLSIDKLKDAISSIEIGQEEKEPGAEDNLLDVVGYLNEQINKRKEAEEAMMKAMVEAEKANIAKSEFLSIMSHEIRTPLNAVIGLGHILLRQDPRPDQVKNLNVLRTSADNLLTLINDILDFSKIEAGKLELEHMPFDLHKVVNDLFLATEVKALERENNMVLEWDEGIPRSVVGDQLRLMQVLNNLLSNAVKFTHKGKVTLSLHMDRKTDTQCRIRFAVTDSGVGIDEKKLEHIFKPFSQASSSITRQYGGTGLGLAITSELLQLMNSQIQVKTTLGKGSTFQFTLDFPYVDQEVQESESLAILEHDFRQARILLVEDTPFNVLFATQLLEGWNATVDVAENGLVAVEKMRFHAFDIVLMDLQMPEMDGYTATRKIREFNAHTPIMALTASASNDVREKITACGMQDYVTKPFNPDDLFLRIRKSISK